MSWTTWIHVSRRTVIAGALAVIAMPSILAVAGDKPELANLPIGVTSFGAAISDGNVYVYGGHMGAAHEYAQKEQSNEFWKLSLDSGKWQQLESGPRLTGVALVSHQGKLYRVGGFQVRNKDGEAANLVSLTDAAVYDTKSNKWSDLPAMPSGRSSHDAVVLNGKLYVLGGWNMQGPNSTTWQTTGCVLDLAHADSGWQAIDGVPVERRALSVASHNGKLYMIGGMAKAGGPTAAVEVYDPAGGKWTSGPALPTEKAMEGFGNSSIDCGGKLIVSTMSGKVFQLSADGNSWQTIGKLAHPRFFHRLLAHGTSEVIAVGGGHMETGKVREVERFAVPLKTGDERASVK